MKDSQKSNVLAVVIAATLCPLSIEMQGYDVAFHFWIYSLMSLCFIVHCYDKQPILKGYALLNFIHICLYIPLISRDFDSIHNLLWYNYLPLSTIMLIYELAMLIFGGRRAIMAIYNWAVNVNSRGRTSSPYFNKGF